MNENESLLYIIESAAQLLRENQKTANREYQHLYDARASLREAIEFYQLVKVS